ncbi:MAG: hypothetical protein JNL08_06180 [Planctomycetes bacterium]|nr:hypothetical protein [Planctomycetota bacterium]
MARLSRLGLSVGCVAALLPAQAPTPFQVQLSAALAKHPFFRDVTLDVAAKKPPFLFFVQALVRTEEEKRLQAVVNPVLPHLNELLRVFDETYCQPNGLTMRAGAEQIAIAILGSRGLYDDYARATSDPSLHQSLAHYNHQLRLAVTYRAGFGSSDGSEDRHSLLHEVVHALQHAYSTTGAMPKPIWFDEGLAEYRASSTHVARSLREPPLIEHHVYALLYAFAHPEARKLLLPLGDLVVPESYAQVVEMARRHAGAGVPANDVLSMFYAQSEMVVRFLHEGDGGAYRDGFVRYFKAVQSGASGLQAFQDAFGLASPDAVAALDAKWRAWLGALFSARLGVGVDLGSGKGLERHAMPPPVEFDFALLAWQDDEFAARVEGIYRTCSRGEYERAAGLLPARVGGDPANDARLRRVRAVVQELIDLRQALVADVQKRGTAQVGTVTGKFVRADGDGVVLAGKGQETLVPITPQVLLAHGLRAKAFAFANCWKEAVLRWFSGQPRAEYAELLAKDYSRVADLRADLAVELGADYGREAEALERFQRMTMPTDPAAARTALTELLAATRRSGPLFARRKQACEQLSRALAERAFALDDAETLGIHGEVTALPDGRVRVAYADPVAAPAADFTVWPDAPFSHEAEGRIAYDGPAAVQPMGPHWGVIGEGFLRWAMPVVGPHQIECDFQIDGEHSWFLLMFCVAPGRYLIVAPSGALSIADGTTGIQDASGNRTYVIDVPHRLSIVHDGAKTVTVSLDGKQTATLPSVGNCLGGSIVLAVRSSTPVLLRNLTITGKLDPSDPAAIRARYVERVLAGMWQAAPAGAAAGAGAAEAAVDVPVSPRAARAAALEPPALAAADAALKWLVQHQDADGRWDAGQFMKHDTGGAPCTGGAEVQHDVGVTALALLALGARGNTSRHGEHKDAFRRGLDWLLRQQNMGNGLLVRDLNDRRIYDHALAVLALVEAAVFSRDERCRQAAQAGVDYLESHRNPYAVWHYLPRTNDNSTPLTVWCTEACVAARDAGLRQNPDALHLAAIWLDQVSDPSGNHGYTKLGESSSRDSQEHMRRFPPERVPTLAAAALFARQLLGQDPKVKPILQATVGVLAQQPPAWDPAKATIDECYWYWASHALARHGGKAAPEWRRRLLAELVRAQCRDGNAAGSWDPIGVWSAEGGRVFTTAMLALCLLAPARAK